jgi:hypothetical protein
MIVEADPRGLAEGAWEVAVAAMRTLDLSAIVAGRVDSRMPSADTDLS